MNGTLRMRLTYCNVIGCISGCVSLTAGFYTASTPSLDHMISHNKLNYWVSSGTHPQGTGHTFPVWLPRKQLPFVTVTRTFITR